MGVNNKKDDTIIKNVAGMLPFLFILAMLIFHMVLPDKTFSKEEKRYLAQWPRFYVENVLNGSYAPKVEAYFSDQFPFRSLWVGMKERSDQILFKGTTDI